MKITTQRFAIPVLSLLFVAVVFCLSSSGVDGLPAESNQATEATPVGSHKPLNSHDTKKKHESSDHHISKKSNNSKENTGKVTPKKTHAEKISKGSTTEHPVTTKQHIHNNSSSIPKGHKAAKMPLPTDTKDLALPTDLSSASEVVKRNSVFNVFEKPAEIEVKTYTPPPNAFAVIEVRPETSDGDKTTVQNGQNENSWPAYHQYPYPQETGGPLSWYLGQYQQPVPPGLSYVPTEELLYSQSFSSNPSVNSQLLYQYPVNPGLYNIPEASMSQPKHLQDIPKLLNNQASANPVPVLPNIEANRPAQSSASNPDTPQLNQFVIPQNQIQTYYGQDSNEIQKSLSIIAGPEMTYKPGIIKYVTNSYYLKTHPKLEWVPM